MAGAAALGTPFAPEIMLLYVANLFWTLGYDTIYACQDMEDDAMVGVKSSARALGGNIPSAFWSSILRARRSRRWPGSSRGPA